MWFVHLFLCFVLFRLFCFLVLHPRHMEVPRLGVELELHLLAYTKPQQHETPVVSATYTTAHSNAGPLTHWARPGIEPVSSWILVGFLTHCATTRTPLFWVLFVSYISQNEIIWCFSLSIWLISLNLIPSRSIHVVTDGKISFFFFCLFRAEPLAYRSSPARVQVGAAAASLHYSHSNMASEPHLWPTSQLMAVLDP